MSGRKNNLIERFYTNLYIKLSHILIGEEMTTKQEREMEKQAIEYEAKIAEGVLHAQKAKGNHVVILKPVNVKIVRVLLNKGFVIWANRHNGYQGTYLCDLQHTIPCRK